MVSAAAPSSWISGCASRWRTCRSKRSGCDRSSSSWSVNSSPRASARATARAAAAPTPARWNARALGCEAAKRSSMAPVASVEPSSTSSSSRWGHVWAARLASDSVRKRSPFRLASTTLTSGPGLDDMECGLDGSGPLMAARTLARSRFDSSREPRGNSRAMLTSRGAALWRDRTLRFALGGAAPVVTAVFALARNKWLAEHLATSGMGVLGQVFSTQTLLGTAAGMGLALPVARALAAATATADARAAHRSVWTALALAGGAALALALPALLLAPWLSQALLGTPEHASLLRIATIGVVGLALQAVANGVFAGRSDVAGPLAVAL